MMIGLARFLRRLRGDRRGVSAVEFALLAPVMIAFYFGACEFCQGFMAQKRIGHIASTVADLIAQDDNITTSEMNDIFTVSNTLIRPFPNSGLTQRASSVAVDTNGVARVQWSRGSGMTARAANSVVTLPTGMAAKGESVIMTEIAYAYQSPVGYVLPGVTNLRRTYYLRPRLVDNITFD